MVHRNDKSGNQIIRGKKPNSIRRLKSVINFPITEEWFSMSYNQMETAPI
jgi:hypothetical protein